MTFLTPRFSIAVACSREGWAIGEGLAWFYKWLTIGIGTVFAVAIVSGIVIGARKGRERFWRQIALHLAAAAVFLIVAWLIGLLYLDISYTRSVELGRREYAIINTWLAPLKNPVAGELDRALAAVVDADIAKEPGRRGYLISVLPDHLELIDSPLNDNERRALIALASRLRAEDAQLGPGNRAESYDRLDATVAWLLEKPDLPAALQACTGRKPCTDTVMKIAERWCKRQIAECRSGFTVERLATTQTLVKGDQAGTYELEIIRHHITRGALP